MAFDPARPFLFFDDARSDAPLRLYQGETARIEALSLEDVTPAIARMREELSAGSHLAGYLCYEAGGAFEPRMAAGALPPRPLLSFGVYRAPQRTHWAEVAAAVQDRRAEVEPPRPQISRSDYYAALQRVLGYICAGDIYQANVTLSLAARWSGHPLALYARMRAAQLMPHGAVQRAADGSWTLSASPELFFELSRGTITARPMKGTAPRSPTAASDRQAAEALARDPKNRAENLMITDLVRNDLSRVAARGSVRVRSLFQVETYPTVHQMVTTVEARLAAGCDSLDAVRAMFPCGSITGAPKIRAAQIIDEVERGPRGIYTGSIGWLAPDGDARFNIAIRTAELMEGGDLRMGVGAGIVADSDPQAEWRETMSKAEFLKIREKSFHLIETMRFDPEAGIVRLDLHLDRLRTSAERLGFSASTHTIGNLLQVAVGRLKVPRRVKLVLARDGSHAVTLGELPPATDRLNAALAPLPVEPLDIRLFHKTSDRDFYDEARRCRGADEVVFAREDGLLTEGSFTNLFLRRGQVFLTPRAESGLLPGILRREMLESGEAEEAELSIADLDDGALFLGNSLRGLVPARIVAPAKSGA